MFVCYGTEQDRVGKGRREEKARNKNPDNLKQTPVPHSLTGKQFDERNELINQICQR